MYWIGLIVWLATLQYVGTSVETGESVWIPVYTQEQLQPDWDNLIRHRNGELVLERRAAERAAAERAATTTTSSPPPTPYVTTTTTTQASHSGIVWRPTVERWRGLVQQYFDPKDIEHALAIIRCESLGDPNAYNPGGPVSGLFQHRDRYWAARSTAAGWGGSDIFSPEANVAVAAWLVYHNGGWKHWSGAAWGVDSCEEWAQDQGV
jgi:hypothetical protein